MSSNYERTAGSRRRFDAWGIAGWVFLFLLMLFTVLPMLWMLSTSFKTQLGALQYPPEWIPSNPTPETDTRLLDPTSDLGRTFLRYMGNSLLVSTATTIIGVVVAVPAAYAFSRFRFPGKNALFYGVLLRNMFPAVIFLIPLFI